MTQLNRWIKQQTGINITPDKQDILKSAVNELARKNNVSATQYVQLLLTGEADHNQFVDKITTPESFFLRHKQNMAFVIDNVIKKITQTRNVRILCLPCARGEEPYSFAMMLMDRGISLARVYITGIDISKECINYAKKGIYNSYSLRQVPQDFKQRHFIHAPGNHLKVDPSILGKINFYQVNIFKLSSSMIPPGFDVIFCHNLLIYFDKPTINMALKALDSILSPQGWLFVDITEVPNVGLPFKRVDAGSSFAFQKANAAGMKNNVVPVAARYKAKQSLLRTSTKSTKKNRKVTLPKKPISVPEVKDVARLTLQRAKTAYSTKDFHLARELFNKLMSYRSYKAKAYLGLAAIFSDVGEDYKALEYAETAQNLIADGKGLDKSEQIKSHSILAVTLYRKGLVDQAMVHFKSLKKLAPNHKALKLIENLK